MTIRREDLISRRSAAKHLGIHANTLDRWAAEAELKKYHVRGDTQVYYLRSAIESSYEMITEVVR